MLRLLGFFVLVIIAMRLLQALPGIGHLFHGLLGFWLVAILVSLALTKGSGVLLEHRRLSRQIEELGRVDSAHNQGKLGALYVAHSRPRRAIEPLRAAIAGEPENPEWRYRLGCALTGVGQSEEAAELLASVAAQEEEYAYGAVQLRLAEARTRAGDAEGALAAVDRFERNHGESPESTFRRGVALKAAGRRAEARESFGHVAEVARRAARFQRRQSAEWIWKAALARWT